MKRFCLSLVLVIVLAGAGQAQYFDLGFMVGLSNYQGDLSNNSTSLYLKESNLGVGIFGRYNFNDLLGLKLGVNYGLLSGRDANSPFEEVRVRNLNFRSQIVEGALTAELNIPGYQPYAFSKVLSAYIFGGIGFTYFQPQAFYDGGYVKLQPLGTEGQGMPNFSARYSNFTLVIPMGIGVKYALTDKLNLGLEVGARMALTDFLDDVSGNYVSTAELSAGNGELAAALGNRTGEYLDGEKIDFPTGTPRGDAVSRDWYYLAGLTLSWNFNDTGLAGSRSRNRRKSGCITF